MKPNLMQKKGKKRFGLIALVIISTFFAAFGQYFIKKGLNQTAITSLQDLMGLLNFSFVFGFGLYGVSAVMLVIALRKGKLSVLYPIISLGFIWVALLGLYLLKETLSFANWLGIIVIIGGASLVGMGEGHG